MRYKEIIAGLPELEKADRFKISKRKAVHGSDIAGELGVSRPTVSVALKALADTGKIWKEGNKVDKS